jgi:hypothetical protein
MESESYDPMLSSAFERRADLADEVEARLNAGLPEGLRAHWYEGEFFVSVDCGADAWSGESCEFCDDDSCACFCHCD